MANVPILSLPVALSVGAGTDYLEVSKYTGTPGALYQSVRATPQVLSNAVLSAISSGLEYTISNLGSALLTGVQPYITMPYAASITGATLVCSPSGSLTIDIWRCSYAQFDGGSTHPVSGDSITGSNPLIISSSGTKTTSTLTGWNTSLGQGDILAFNISSASGVTQATVTLYLNRAVS